jgi:multiple sugar transport system ATP-binding protein
MADKIVVMNAGKMEQVPPPGTHDNPANLFVAGFIGSPAMNFIPGKEWGSVAIAPESIAAAGEAQARSKREVIVGVRPEHLAVSATGVPLRWWWSSPPAPIQIFANSPAWTSPPSCASATNSTRARRYASRRN